jgi:hypothetical protein
MLRSHRLTILKLLSVLGLFIFAVGYITYPLIWHLGDIVTHYGDEFVISWIENWVIHALTTDPLKLWDSNAYFPYHNTLAYSDLLLTASILAMLPAKLIGQPVAAFNFTVISSLVLLGYSVFLLSYYVTRDWLLAILAGILVVFSPAVLDKNVHIQILAIEWVPLSMLSFFHFMKTRRSLYLLLSLGFFVLQALNSLMPAYFIAFFYLICVGSLWLRERKLLVDLCSRRNIGMTVAVILFLAVFLLPYYQVSHQFGYVRPLKDSIHFALQPEDFIYSHEYTRLNPFLLALSNSHHYQTTTGELKPGYLGVVLSLLSICTTV